MDPRIHASGPYAPIAGEFVLYWVQVTLRGRDPNSYAGIAWILGKFDRPFYRRPIYGLVRYMSLRAAAKKFDVEAWIRRFEPQIPQISQIRPTRLAI